MFVSNIFFEIFQPPHQIYPEDLKVNDEEKLGLGRDEEPGFLSLVVVLKNSVVSKKENCIQMLFIKCLLGQKIYLVP